MRVSVAELLAFIRVGSMPLVPIHDSPPQRDCPDEQKQDDEEHWYVVTNSYARLEHRPGGNRGIVGHGESQPRVVPAQILLGIGPFPAPISETVRESQPFSAVDAPADDVIVLDIGLIKAERARPDL